MTNHNNASTDNSKSKYAWFWLGINKKENQNDQAKPEGRVATTPQVTLPAVAQFLQETHSQPVQGFKLDAVPSTDPRNQQVLIRVEQVDSRPVQPEQVTELETTLANVVNGHFTNYTAVVRSDTNPLPLGAMIPESIDGPAGGSGGGTPHGSATVVNNAVVAPVKWRVRQRAHYKKFIDETDQTPGQPVNVFVLDTVPYATKQELIDKIKLFTDSDNPALQEIAQRAVNSIDIIPPGVPNTSGTTGANLYRADLKWHGLFIAGIILSMLKNPASKVYLVRAADVESGFSTFQDITSWLINNVNHGDAARPLLVNLSLTTNPEFYRVRPDPDDLVAAFAEAGIALSEHEANLLTDESTNPESPLFDWLLGWNYDQKNADPTADPARSAYKATQKLLDLYSSSQNRCIVASAANIYGVARNTKHAGYPARLNGIVSVGALGAEDDVADYSHVAKLSADAFQAKMEMLNNRDLYERLVQFLSLKGEGFDDAFTLANGTSIPRSDAFYVFGGNETRKNDINSMYLDDIWSDELQSDIANFCGVSGWRGTSFSAAVITAVLARLCELSDNTPGTAVEKALQKLRADASRIKSNVPNAGYYFEMEQF